MSSARWATILRQTITRILDAKELSLELDPTEIDRGLDWWHGLEQLLERGWKT